MAGERANPLRDALKECRSGLVLLAVFSFFINLLILTSPIYMMQVYDRVLTSGKTETLVLLTVIAGIAVLVLGMLEMVRNRVLARIGQWLDRRLSPELIRCPSMRRSPGPPEPARGRAESMRRSLRRN